WRGDGGPAAVALRRDPAGWRLAEARGPGNDDLADEVLMEIVAAVRGAGARTGGGGGAAREEADAVGELIARLQAELEVLREADPVRQEMLRLREELKGATAAERAEVEDLIQRIREERAEREAAAAAAEFWRSSIFQALDGLIVRGRSASDVMRNLAQAIASAALQSALLGTGPLAGLFGGAGKGGLLGLIFPSLGAQAKADGGMIRGPGGPRDDVVPAWLSNGEFVVNAAATARHRPLLEAINDAGRAGAWPRFAAGGLVGAPGVGPVSGGGMQVALELRLSEMLDARVAEIAEGVALRLVRGGIDQFSRKVLPGRVGQITGQRGRVIG
ncbi:MAG: hypothetical protein ACK4QW_16010, partial [Alphaproteobacteria bacterium]